MSQQINLKKLEQKAYRSNFQDGAWDIFLGLLLFQSVIDVVLYRIGWPPTLILMTTLGYVVLVLVAFTLVKKYVITPRIGLVNFGPVRKAKNKKLMLLLSLSILGGVIVFAGIVAGYFEANSGAVTDEAPMTFVPLGLIAVVPIVVFSVAAYLLDFSRAYLYGWFFGLALPLNVLLDERFGISFPLATAVFSAVMVLIGLVLFVHFLQTHPLNRPDWPEQDAV
ncbi:MAG: hypothetical protein GY796_03430 [Chloroflexi bacterium]|nr:hypothetical protein [Chloroflexota bacterium]